MQFFLFSAVFAHDSMDMDDVQTVRAEGTNIRALAPHAIPDGEKAVEALRF